MRPLNPKAAEHLNTLLEGEIAAVETYGQALEKIADPDLRINLRDVQSNHLDRIRTLSSRVRELGGEPANDSGAWGAMAKVMEGGATLFGDKSAIDMLETGED